MIRFLLLTIIPLLLPFAVWYVWKVWSGRPRIDPATGDQVPPDIVTAPRLKLLIAGFLLMAATVGVFLLAHDRIAEAPYKPLDMDKAEEKYQQGIAPDRATKPN